MEVSIFSFFLILFLGIVPPLLWLLYYLRKDIHPEPKEIILQLFLIGFLLPPFVGFVEIMLQGSLEILPTSLSFGLIIALAALWEEGTKYLAARTIFHHEKEFDELTDAMIYLIVVGLGFAASENVIIALSSLVEDPASNVFLLLGLRAIGATLLHALASGIIGYFLARSLFLHERFSLAKGLAGATLIHAFFNWFILETTSQTPGAELALISLLIVGVAIILTDFHNLKQYDIQ